MKSFKKSFSLLLVLVLSLVTFLSACAGTDKTSTETASKSGGSKDGVVEIDFWTFWGSEIRRPIIEKIIDDFNKSQDKIHVKHTYLPFGDIWTKELAAVAAGNPPDVIINDINAVRQRAEKNQVESLEEFSKKDPGLKDQYFPELWNAVTTEEGVPFALPFNTDTRLLFWNKDIFKEVGLDPETPPKTWEELKEFARKIDQKNGNRYNRLGFLPRHGINSDVWMINATGEGYWDYKAGKPTINDEKAVKALEWVYDYEQHYGDDVINAFKAEFGENQADPFVAGKLGMAVQSATSYTKIRDYGNGMNFGVAPMPEMEPGSGNTSWGGGFVAEIPKGSKHKEAAYEFIKYLTGPEAQEYWAVKNFDNVANIEAAEKAANSSVLSEADQHVYKAAVENMKDTILTPFPLEAPDYINLINPELDQALLGQKTSKKALDDAQKAVEKLVESTK
ncbi:multiple sugar transport system substrate-binding protein [Neobacillus niacini]|uniref:ABC transporter substrate-binding protein n=1 Tax=Neobacillus driksii TaxID=3035913 RepID=UPI00278A9411|nr:ABC transporter substrate-binding protein [Neobacillus niacini]MDQ0972547.1 multiple sugar transport system substrate-binding protein [Neobacillus niacini]